MKESSKSMNVTGKFIEINTIDPIGRSPLNAVWINVNQIESFWLSRTGDLLIKMVNEDRQYSFCTKHEIDEFKSAVLRACKQASIPL